jgi:hypothetical protein
MKLDGATIAIEPRSVGACVVLAVLFSGAHSGQVLGLTLIFGTPICLLTYVLVDQLGAGLGTGLLLFFAGAPFLAAAVVAGAGQREFGDPFPVWGTLRILASQFFRLVVTLLLAQIVIAASSLLCFLPPLPLSVFYGFLPELLLLEQSRGFRFEARTRDLMRGTFFDLLLRFVVIAGFYLCTVLSLFTLIDLTSDIVLSTPVLFGRISGEFFFDDVQYLLMHDPLVVTAICATMWLAYPLARLAWFFCYLDTRIRKEAWDVELDFRIEAQRLEAAQGARE